MELIPEAVRHYADNHTSPEPDLLKKINRETHVNYLFPRMLSGHYQGRLLGLLSGMIRPSAVLEIGTYTGYGTICLAEGLKKDGIIHTIEINIELEEVIQQNILEAGIKDRVKLYFGDAREIIPGIKGGFDLVYLDADKINYLTYFEMLIDRINPGGYIFADNVLWSGKVIQNTDNDKEAGKLQEFNDFIQADNRVENILLPVRDGIMVIQKRL